jgi:CDGSH-type Zn-finger protein
VTITAYQDGPYLVRGPFTMLDQEGRQIAMQRRTIALCRCGKSRLRPLCDGTHRAIGFRAMSGAENQAPSMPAPEQSQPADAVEPAGGQSAGGGRRRSAEIGTIVRAGRSRGLGDRVALLEDIRWAEQCLEQSLRAPCTATDHAAMSLAEPLLTAARRLLEWGETDVGEPVLSRRSNGHGPARVSRSGSEDLVTRALASTRRLEPHEDPRLHQVRSLLTDAAKALAS